MPNTHEVEPGVAQSVPGRHSPRAQDVHTTSQAAITATAMAVDSGTKYDRVPKLSESVHDPVVDTNPGRFEMGHSQFDDQGSPKVIRYGILVEIRSGRKMIWYTIIRMIGTIRCPMREANPRPKT